MEGCGHEWRTRGGMRRRYLRPAKGHNLLHQILGALSGRTDLVQIAPRGTPLRQEILGQFGKAKYSGKNIIEFVRNAASDGIDCHCCGRWLWL